jgi:hypothetical protein
MSALDLGSELHAVGVAVGLLDEHDNLRTDWFSDPIAKLRRILIDPVQRAALLDAIDGILPEDPDGPDAAGETRHPLIDDAESPAQVFLTLRRTPDGEAELGLAAGVHADVGAVAADVMFAVGLVHASSAGLTAVVGTEAAPLRLNLDLRFDQKDIGFDSIRVDARVAPLATPSPTADVQLEVGVVGADGKVTLTALDPQHLEADALQLVTALLQHRLDVLAADTGTPPALAALAHHLLPVAGLGADLPALPLDRIGVDEDLLREWLSRLLDATVSNGKPAMEAWLEHVSGLFGVAPPTGTGTEADPWAIRIAALGSGGIELTFAVRTVSATRQLLLGGRLHLDAAALRAEAATTLFALPLSGTAVPIVLPAASAAVYAPRDPGAKLVDRAELKVGALRGGFAWNGATLRPLLELIDLQFGGAAYPVVDFSNIDSAQAAVADALRDAIKDALGTNGPGRHLAALAGVLPPVSDEGSPLADPVALVAAPTRELARVHRLVLTDPARGWKHMLGALGGVLGLTGERSGAGTQDDPWRIEIASVAPLTLELAAWNAESAGTDPALLRIGLRASAVRQPLAVSWLAELIAVDLPVSGAASMTLMAGQHARLRLTGPFQLEPLHGISISLSDADMAVDWQPGQRLAPVVHVNGLALTGGVEAVALPTLVLPPAGFDPTLPDLGLGLSPADLLAAVRILLSRLAASRGGTAGFTLAGLLGLHGQLPGLPSDWPLLSLPAGAGLDVLLTDPLGPLRTWLARVTLELSADGTPFLQYALSWLRGWLRGSLPDLGLADFGALDLDVGGSGSYDDPWRLGLTDGGHSELFVWLEPDGPPAAWASALDTLAAAAKDPGAVLELGVRLQAFAPGLRGTFGDVGIAGLASALTQIDSELGAGDGVVPVDAQVPDSAGWAVGVKLVDAAHHLLPAHPDAISQIVAQLDAWQPEDSRAALFVGPPFADKSAWSALLASVGGTAPGAHFDLRSAPDPAVAPLGAVTAEVAHYTADLMDTGADLSAVIAQIAAVVGRIRALRGQRPVILVAHSTAGLAAREFAAANPTLVKGLITLGTPHGPAPLSALLTPDGSEAVRAVHRLLLAAGTTGTVVDAVKHLTNVLDGWDPGPPGARATILEYPLSRFAGAGDTSTGGVPALALAGQLGGGVLAATRTALRSVAQSGATRSAPTHLAFGLRAALPAPAVADGAQVDAGVRIDAFRVRVAAGAPQPARAAHRLDVDIRLARPGDWLVASAAARVRRAELGLTVEAPASGLVATPRMRLYDAGLAAPTQPLVELGNAMAEGLLDAVVARLVDVAHVPGPGFVAAVDTPGSALVDALEGLGMIARDATGRPGLSADALGALRADALAFLGQRIQPALERSGGLLGISGPAGGPWRLAVPGTPLEVQITRDPWRVGLRTGQGLELGSGLRLDAEVDLTFPALNASVLSRLSRDELAIAFSSASGALTLTPHAGADPISLAPPAVDLPAQLAQPLLEAVGSAVATAGLEHMLGPGWSVASVVAILRDPGEWLRSSAALGNGSEIVGERMAALLKAVSVAAGDASDEPGLALPAGFRLDASGTPVTITLSTSPLFAIPAPGGNGTLDVSLSATIDRRGHVTPGGRLIVDVPLDGTWGGLALTLGLDAGQVSLSIAPRPTAGGGSPLPEIVLLPRFGGLGPLAVAAAEALLPAVLDAIVDQLPLQQSLLADAALAVADALGIHGGTPDPSFAAHGEQLRALAQPGALENLVATALPGAIASLWTAAGLPGTLSADAPAGVRWAGGIAGATAGARVGWAADLGVGIEVDGLTAGPMRVHHLAAGFTAGAPSASLDVSVTLPPEVEKLLGLELAPDLSVVVSAGALTASLLPLGPDTEGTLAVRLLPRLELAVGVGGPASLIEQWALPLAANAAVSLLELEEIHLWNGGPTLGEVLTAAGLMDGQRVAVPLPAPSDLLLRTVATLAQTAASLKVTDTLQLQLVVDTSRNPPLVGVGLHGHIDVSTAPVRASIRLGEPAPTWIPDPAPALRLLLVESSTFELRPELRLAPLGVRVTGADDTPLLDGKQVHLGAAAGYVWVNFDFSQGVKATDLGAAVELDDIGLPLSGASGESNPVAASLLGSDHDQGAATNGDEQGLAPGLGLVGFKQPDGDFALLRVEDGAAVPFDQHPLWFGIHRSFGPLSIDQIGFAYLSGPPRQVEVMVDGGVSAGGLTIQADDLGLIAPLNALANPAQWRLDLKGLAVGMQAGPVSLAGGLIKNPGPPIDYAGIVNVQVAGKGFSAVGAYSRPTDAEGAYTSLFVFVALPIVIGGPPYLFITGLAGGAGYNRRLIPPVHVTDVESFPLVTAINGGLVNNPMQALGQLGAAMPPRRGSLWLAAGLRFTSFALVETTAIAYVALDRGLEVGVLGLSRAALPKPSNALVQVELAIKARLSTEEGVLSVQAQLTDNSWLLSPDCQLTGGFAFFVWFKRGQFVLTLGGYHPAFAKPQEFPVVPRLGFHWAVSDSITIKGESYFALTSSCVMAGGRLEASYQSGGGEASFAVYADFLISWDPFHYDISAGVSVSAGFRIRVCFIACVTIDIHMSLSASVHILGPPLHGEATLDLELFSVTVEFGSNPEAPPNFLGWAEFASKYVVAGARDGSVVSAHAGKGLLAPESGKGSEHPGSSPADPWRFVSDFTLSTETRMPATGYTVAGASILPPLNEVPGTLDLAPMNIAAISSSHSATITSLAGLDISAQLRQLTIVPAVGKVPGALWRLVDHPVAAATLQNACTGIAISGSSHVVVDSQWRSGSPPVIPISVLIDESIHVPLGLASSGPSPQVDGSLAQAVTAAPGPALVDAAADLLGAGGAGRRKAAGLPARGAPALSLQVLRHRRSSPPLLATLGAGMDQVPSPRPRQPSRVAAADPVPEPQPPTPMLRAILRGPLPSSPAPPAAPATSAPAVAAGFPRTSPPGRPRHPLRRTAVPRTGGPRRHNLTMRPLVPHEGGFEVAAGSLHVWDLAGGTGAFLLTGSAAARAVFLDRAGAPITDLEAVPGDGLRLEVPTAAAKLAVSCLGLMPDGLEVTTGPGAISLAAAAHRGVAAVGWQDAALVARVAPAALLARGASVRLGAPLRSRVGALALLPAVAALAQQTASETTLPATVDVVLVILDARGAVLPTGAPRVLATGATLSAPPLVVVGGRRLHLFYTVSDRKEGLLRVAVGGEQWQTAGVLGLRGRAEEWATDLAGGAPRQLISDGPLTAAGSVTVSHETNEDQR